MPEKTIKQLFLMLFSLLSEHALIESKKIILQGKKIYKTLIQYRFHTIKYTVCDEEVLNWGFNDFKLLQVGEKYYIQTIHYSRLFEICKENFFSNKSFKPKDINYLMGKINLKLYIDEDFINQQKNIRSKDEIIFDICTIINEIKSNYLKNVWTLKTDKTISELQKKYSKLLEEYSVYIFLKQDTKFHIYFALYLDFRGRKYYDSIIGPTQSRFLRTAFYYGYYNWDDFKNKKESKELLTYYDDIRRICEKNNYDFKECFYDIYYWCIIGIGKFLVDKDNYPIDEREFILETEKHLANNKFKLKKNDLLEIEHYTKIMKSLTIENALNGKIKKYVIVKDATASVNQILMKKLLPKNQESMNFVNLGCENKWYDTYSVCRGKFTENYKNKYNANWLKSSLPRTLIKKVIMIIPYSAGFELCWETYIHQIKEENYSIEINSELKLMIKDFYKFIKKEMQEKYLYNKSSNSYFKKINEEFEQKRKYVIESETGEADISYFKMKRISIEKRYNINNSKKRITKLMLEVTPSIDINMFNSSVGPNVAHFFDADEIREVELHMNKFFITVHDCYLVDMLSCTDLVRTKQKHYSKHIPNYNISNIFIVL
jgi:hypothetical protein